MENPLISSDSGEPKPVQPQAPVAQPTPTPAPAEVPAATSAASKPVKKKSFFTTGKILAIVGIAVVLIAIVGAVIYSQTSERFQGSTFTHKAAPIGTTTMTTAEPIELIAVPQISTDICDSEIGQIVLDGECVCAVGSIYDYGTETCITDFCDLTELSPGNLKKASGDPYTAPKTFNELSAILGDYDTWYNDNCVPATTTPLRTFEIDPLITTRKIITPDEKTLVPKSCDDYIPVLRDAYVSRNWDSFQGALVNLDALGCLDTCKSKLLWNIFYLWTGDITSAKNINAKYTIECSTCDNKFELLALNSQLISDIDKAGQEAGNVLDVSYTDYLTAMATSFVPACPCAQLEAFINNPGFDISAILPTATLKTGELSVTDAIKSVTRSPLTYLNEDVLTIAYAQSASLSPAVMSVLETVFSNECIVPDPQPVTQPENCSSLEITLPSTDDMTISEDFDSATDNLEFSATGTDNIANYRITASNDTLVFGGQDDDVYSDYDSVTLSGGPVVDDPVTITVQAIDVTGLPLTECIDSITISRAPVPEDDPVCRSLDIIAPEDATALVIPAGGFSDQNLTVQIDGDQGSWGDIKYNTVSENGDITFNSEATLVTTDQTVLMNGKPSGATETITVWALDPTTGTGIASCNDSFTVTVDNDTPPTITYTPPVEDDGPPTLAYTPPVEEDDPPSLAYTPPVVVDDPPTLAYTPPVESDPIIPVTPDDPPLRLVAPVDPVAPAPYTPSQPSQPSQPAQPGAPAPFHEAPYTPQTGPGVLIPMIGIAIGGAWMRRKRK